MSLNTFFLFYNLYIFLIIYLFFYLHSAHCKVVKGLWKIVMILPRVFFMDAAAVGLGMNAIFIACDA